MIFYKFVVAVTVFLTVPAVQVDGSPKSPDRDKNCSGIFPDPCGTGCPSHNYTSASHEVLFSDFFGPVPNGSVVAVS